ncbi:MAG: tRNA (adenosine(37)-N6)-threonylcarbamoyltransferase complex dimerization subunit type 1 TsaB [Bacteroidales bacterium]|nr:tRNA (adenosine(37)-N6)-threonylcarbamoyltransferase complex dimerization subunit type 1 TsaB [Bacteroidales bacterium]
MIKILHIDTANEFCSVALSQGNLLIGLRETDEKNAHARVVTLFADDILKENNIKAAEIDAVAVSMGPGSYTGLRIGVSAAKGFCYALDKPLIAVGTLEAMATGSIERVKAVGHFDPGMIFCPMIDARRMEVYSAMFDGAANEIRETRAEIIDDRAYEKELQMHQIVFSGSGAEKCKSLLSSSTNAFFLNNLRTSAKFMIPVAIKKFNKGEFEDVAYFEPFYLKSFVAGLPKVKGLR